MRNWYLKAKNIYEFHNRKLEEEGQNFKSNGSKKSGWSYRESGKALGLSHVTIYKLYMAYKLTLQWPEYKELSRPQIYKLTTSKEMQDFLRANNG